MSNRLPIIPRSIYVRKIFPKLPLPDHVDKGRYSQLIIDGCIGKLQVFLILKLLKNKLKKKDPCAVGTI